MNTIQIVEQWFADDDLSEGELIEFLQNIGTTQKSIDRIVIRAKFMRIAKRRQKAKEQEESQNKDQEI